MYTGWFSFTQQTIISRIKVIIFFCPYVLWFYIILLYYIFTFYFLHYHTTVVGVLKCQITFFLRHYLVRSKIIVPYIIIIHRLTYIVECRDECTRLRRYSGEGYTRQIYAYLRSALHKTRVRWKPLVLYIVHIIMSVLKYIDVRNIFFSFYYNY